MTGDPASRQSKLISEVWTALAGYGLTATTIQGDMVINGDAEIPLEDFNSDFHEALARLLGLGGVTRGPAIYPKQASYLSFGPEIPQRRGRHKYGVSTWEMHG